jgi:hypothetical protein
MLGLRSGHVADGGQELVRYQRRGSHLCAAVLAAISLALALFFYLRPRRSKWLSWNYPTANRIIRVSPLQRDRLNQLKVVYVEREVENPNIIVLRIANAGREEIRADDFTRQITILFKQSKLLARDVIDRSSEDIDVTFKVDTSAPNEVAVNPLLLNAGEWIEIQCVTDGPIERPPLRARIAGQTREPANLAVVQHKRTKRVLLGGLICSFIAAVVSGSFVVSQGTGIGNLAALGGVILLGMLSGFIASSVEIRYTGLPWIRRSRRRHHGPTNGR